MSATQRQERRGTVAQNATFTGATGETIYLTDKGRLVCHNGSTTGGFWAARTSDFVTNEFVYGVSSGTNTITLSVDAKPTSTGYTSGHNYVFKAGSSNTASATLNVNSIGAITLKKMTSSGLENLEAGDIIANGMYRVYYNGTNFVLANPSSRNRQRPIASTSISGSPSSVDFTDVFQSGKNYRLELSNILLDSSSILALRVAHSGSSFISTSSYAGSFVGVTAASSTNLISISGGGPDQGNDFSGFIDIFNPQDSSNGFNVTSVLTYVDNVGGSSIRTCISSGKYLNSNAIGSLQILINGVSRTFSSGLISLYEKDNTV